jgi:hypothetical protein
VVTSSTPQTPLERARLPLSVRPTTLSKPVRHGRPCQRLGYRQRKRRVHWRTGSSFPLNNIVNGTKHRDALRYLSLCCYFVLFWWADVGMCSLLDAATSFWHLRFTVANSRQVVSMCKFWNETEVQSSLQLGFISTVTVFPPGIRNVLPADGREGEVLEVY